MEDMKLLVDLHLAGERQGPGSNEATKKALDLCQLPKDKVLEVADLGCGTGASTTVLAKELNAKITAVDLFPEFLKELEQRTQKKKLRGRISTRAQSFHELEFPEESLDLIWSEGAIYHLGFERGINAWRKHLKPRGVLAVSEITWLSKSRPAEISSYWERAYPEIALPSQKITQLENAGFELLGYFPLSSECWIENFYSQTEKRLKSFLEKSDYSEAAKAVAEEERNEFSLYQEFGAYYSYGFYIARRI